ncbi:acetoacetate decarboxylase family protein [Microbispora sp. CA-102843]|uniref:acetoacetate decarboxylase family protein n=1 Tax=Microbispora sp. CA-102843 TaxID=3239952 RepID=UPI003D93B53A
MTMRQIIATIPSWSPLYPLGIHEFRDTKNVTLLCRTRPGLVGELLPYPLTGGGDYLRVKWSRVGKVVDRTDLYNMEFILPCSWNGEAGSHVPLEYIADDMGLCVGREVFAWPKKGGEIVWEEDGEGRIHLECRRGGHTLITTDFTPGDPGAVEWPAGGPTFQVRHLTTPHEDVPVTAETIRLEFPGRTLRPPVFGAATLELHDGPGDPLEFLGPLEVVAARIDFTDFDFGPGVVVDQSEISR